MKDELTAKEIARTYETSPESGVYIFTAEELQSYADALCKEQRDSLHRTWT